MAVFDVELSADGYMTKYKPIGVSEEANGLKVYAYVETYQPLEGLNNTNISDMMQEKAVDKFIECTYEKYYKEVGEQFGKVIPAIFTDEPQVATKRPLDYATESDTATFSWTTDFPVTFKKQKGFDIVTKLPELVWDMHTPSMARYHYFDHQSERFKNAYVDKIAKWCKAHGILFAGHFAQEDLLKSQSEWLGEAMRLYSEMDIPGLDLLANRDGLVTSKQVVSVARQSGRNTVLSELYGVTGWDFDFRGHKYQGDWHCALGVTVRVPHLSWYSMKGIAKRDYPASISYQSSWFKEYKYLEDHFSRLNVILSRGKPDVKVAVIHPIESYWLNFGPNDTSAERRLALETDFRNIAGWLTENSVDFDFICEALLPTQLKYSRTKTLKVGEMEYSAVIVPPVDTLRGTTVSALESFARRGGKVIFTGKPSCVDAEISDKIDRLYDISEKVAFSKSAILTAIDKQRDIKIRLANGNPAENYALQRRKDQDCEWLMVASTVYHDGRKPEPPKSAKPEDLRIFVDGNYYVTVFDTLTGNTYPAGFEHENGKTIIHASLYQADSLLVQLKPTKRTYKTVKTQDEPKIKQTLKFCDGVDYSLSEPNVMVLDMAKWSLDGKKYNDKEEVLRINEALRKKAGYIDETEGCSQPYTQPQLKHDYYVYLKFEFTSDVSVKSWVAFEQAEEIVFNGKKIKIRPDGYYTDRAIKKTALGKLKKGANTLVVKMPFGKYISLENAFLLGDFGVEVKGACAKVIKKPEKLHFGSVINQGFPFYGGTITYNLPVKFDKPATVNIKTQKYSGALVKASVDGKEAGKIIFSPYALKQIKLEKGKHIIGLELFVSRINSFGTLHGCSFIAYQGPNAWATKGFDWSYEYVLTDGGILKSPVIEITE